MEGRAVGSAPSAGNVIALDIQATRIGADVGQEVIEVTVAIEVSRSDAHPTAMLVEQFFLRQSKSQIAVVDEQIDTARNLLQSEDILQPIFVYVGEVDSKGGHSVLNVGSGGREPRYTRSCYAS